jgi:hypothetical protein
MQLVVWIGMILSDYSGLKSWTVFMPNNVRGCTGQVLLFLLEDQIIPLDFLRRLLLNIRG